MNAQHRNPNSKTSQCKLCRIWIAVSGIWITILVSSAFGAAVDISKLPPPVSRPVNFDLDIRPILESSCLRCHGAERPKSQFRLTSRNHALKGGDDGIDIFPGDSAKSPLIHYVAGLVPDKEMPPPGKTARLTSEQIALLRAWIDQGLPWETVDAAAQFATQFSFTPALLWVGVNGNAQKFQEHQWLEHGYTAGVSDFSLTQTTSNGMTVLMQGHALTDDYNVTLDVRKQDFGFARFGGEQFTRYYNNYGPYYPFPANGFATKTADIFRLNDDLQLNIGKAFAEFGLTKPGGPQITFGYEYRYKNGSEATEEWGPVSQVSNGSTITRNIYPARKNVDESVNVLRLDVSQDFAGTHVEDNIRAEFWDLNTTRYADTVFPPGQLYPTSITQTRETRDQFQFANTLHGEKAINDWLFLSAGYLFTHFNADATFNQNTTDGAGQLAHGQFWSANDIVLDENANVFQVNALGGPWDGFTAALGLLNEWSQQSGFGSPNYREGDPDDPLNPVTSKPGLVESDLTRVVVEENLVMRYTRIPFTVLFAEGRWKQQSIGNYQAQYGSDYNSLRDMDETFNWQNYRIGFEVSPWRWASWSASYNYSWHHNVYNDDILQTPQENAQQGYPGFIRSQHIQGPSVETRLVLRPATWLRTTFAYKIAGTDFKTHTDGYYISTATSPPLEVQSPGGTLTASKYDSKTYSASVTLTPWRRWSLSGTVSYQQSTTRSPSYYEPIIVPYRGNVYTISADSTFALTKRTDLFGNYSYSRAQYGENNFGAGLPLGIDYQLQGFQVGLSQRINPRTQASVRYGYYTYVEPSSNGFNDYTANLVFATVTIRLP